MNKLLSIPWNKNYVSISSKTKDYNLVFGRLFSLFLILNSINLFLKQSFDIIFIHNYLSIFLGLIFLLYFAFSFQKISKCLKTLLLLEAVFSFLLLISIIRHTDFSSAIIGRCSWTILFCIPLFSLSLYCDDWKKMLQTLKIPCLICVILSFFTIIKSYNSDYNMSIGYSLLFPCIFHLSFSKKNPLYLLLFLFDFLIILIFCSRGPILCILVFLAYYLLIDGGVKKHILWKALFTVAFIVIAINFENILTFVSYQFRIRNIYSRTIDLLLNGRITYDSGRSEIIEMILLRINNSPIFGIGVAGELSFMKSYPHNIVIELFLHYGYFFGAFIVAFALYYIVKSFFSKSVNKLYWVIFLSSGLVPLFLSSTYLQSPLFWMFIGFCINAVKKRRCKNE